MDELLTESWNYWKNYERYLSILDAFGRKTPVLPSGFKRAILYTKKNERGSVMLREPGGADARIEVLYYKPGEEFKPDVVYKDNLIPARGPRERPTNALAIDSCPESIVEEHMRYFFACLPPIPPPPCCARCGVSIDRKREREEDI